LIAAAIWAVRDPRFLLIDDPVMVDGVRALSSGHVVKVTVMGAPSRFERAFDPRTAADN
jgi:hypothetical protein